MPTIEAPNNIKEVPHAVINNMINLSTSGFGLVVALAWNEVIRTTIQDYIDPILGKGSGLISSFIYAVAMTFLAVFVTMQLAQIQKRITQKQDQDETSS